MEKEPLIIKIQQLLIHSVREVTFYDQATDQILIPELKSAFAKYLWLRGEHVVGIRSFLIGIEQPVPGLNQTHLQNERFWRFLADAVKQKDNPAILSTGIRYARLSVHKYAETLHFTKVKDRLHIMLQNHLLEIQNVLKEFSSIPSSRKAS